MVAVAVATLVVLAGDARADGGPLTGFDGGQGAATPTSVDRYVTLPAGRRNTAIAAVRRADGVVERWGVVRGRYVIPAVAYDGSGGGLSADGRRLVLIEQSVAFPTRRLRLAILDTARLRVRRTITLAGVYSFDAVSPDLSKIYLVRYLSPTSLTRYAVRALDVRHGRLLARPIVDRRNPGERMRGLPVTRTTSRDGSWAYTLYDGGGDAPFVHALNTAAGTSFCIDLDALAGRKDLFTLHLRLAGGAHRLEVVDNHRPLLDVDTRSFRVTRPPPGLRAPEARAGTRIWIPALAISGLALLGVGFAVRRRARPRAAVT